MNKILSLSKNFLLRKQGDGKYILFNKANDMKYTITLKLFAFLYLFKNNRCEMDVMLHYLKEKGIEIDDIVEFCQRDDLKKLFTTKTMSNMKNGTNIYHNLSCPSPHTEYTPEKIDFLITRHCNLKCRHCFENSSPSIQSNSINLETLFDVFHQMDELNVKTLKITGGEPLSYPHITEILQEISRLRFESIILTNAMLLNQSLINIIVRGNIKLGISLDGVNKESHDYLRGSGAYDILIKKLNMLKQSGANFSITTSLNKKNSLDLEKIAGFVLEDLGAQRFFINQLKPLGRAKNNEKLFLSSTEYRSIVKRVNTLIKKYGERIVLSDDTLMTENVPSDKSTISMNTPLICAAGNTSFSIDDKLDVFPCIYGNGFQKYKIGNLKSQSILDIWLSDKWDIFRGRTILKNISGCATCLHSSGCSLKNCRLKPVYDGQDFYSHVNYCGEQI